MGLLCGFESGSCKVKNDLTLKGYNILTLHGVLKQYLDVTWCAGITTLPCRVCWNNDMTFQGVLE